MSAALSHDAPDVSESPGAPGVRRRTLLAGSAAAVAATTGAVALTGTPAAALARPNILVIVTDDQPKQTAWANAKTIGWLGDHGVTYSHGFAATPLCAPSRSTILTGQYAHNHGVLTNALHENLDHQATVQRYLRAAGYRTGLYGKFLNGWDINDNPPHFDEFGLLAPIDYQDGTFNVNGVVQTIPGYTTTVIGNQASRFIERGGTDTRPWFLYVAPKAPHGPNTPESKYADTAVPAWNGRPSVPEDDRSDKPQFIQNATGTLADGKATRRAQLRTLLSVDDTVQKLHDTLVATGQLDNTLVIYISDNGYAWSDHGWKAKSVPYKPAIEVPFYLSWPAGGKGGGTADNRLVANVDITPTILDAANITPDPAHPIDGHSLLTSYGRGHALTEFWRQGSGGTGPKTWASYVTATRQYTEYYNLYADADGTPTGTGTVHFREYYDLVNDPHQLTNLLYQATPAQEEALGVAALSVQLNADRNSAGTTANPVPNRPPSP